jgi:hypothetical protein
MEGLKLVVGQLLKIGTKYVVIIKVVFNDMIKSHFLWMKRVTSM